MTNRLTRWARLRATVTRHKQTVWESLTEPRKVTLAMMFTYSLGMTLSVVIALSHPGPLPEGVFSAYLVAAIMFFLAGLIGVPGAWRGWWFLEQFAVIMFAFAVGALAVSALWYVHVPFVARAIGLFMALVIEVLMYTRWQRVSKSSYRLGAGPLLPEHQVEVTIAAAMEAEKAETT